MARGRVPRVAGRRLRAVVPLVARAPPCALGTPVLLPRVQLRERRAGAGDGSLRRTQSFWALAPGPLAPGLWPLFGRGAEGLEAVHDLAGGGALGLRVQELLGR